MWILVVVAGLVALVVYFWPQDVKEELNIAPPKKEIPPQVTIQNQSFIPVLFVGNGWKSDIVPPGKSIVAGVEKLSTVRVCHPVDEDHEIASLIHNEGSDIIFNGN